MNEKDVEQEIKEELISLGKRMNLENIDQSMVFPKYFEIETIRACNARCTMCTINDWKDKNNSMSEELFRKILNEISNHSKWIERVCLSRNGEPLLDKNIVERIKLLKERGIKNISFSTNASLLDEKKAIELIEAGLDDIRFSIDGITKETFESIRRGLNFDRVIENCLRFIRLRNERGTKPVIQIRMTLQEKNLHEEKDWKEFWLSKVSEQDIVSSKPMHTWGNQLEEGNNFIEKEEYSYLPCISPWSTMIIHFDGKVPLCGCDYNNKILLGDLNNSTIQQVWQSENLGKVRERHSSGHRSEIPLCNGCNVWDTDRKKVYAPEETI